MIRFVNDGSEFSETLLDYLRTQKIQRLGIVKSELSFFNMLVDGLTTKAEAGELIEVFDTFLPAETDFRSSILKLKSKKFDVLGVYVTPPQVGLFFNQANELNFHPRTFGATPFESKSVIASAWPLMQEAVYTHNAVTEPFRERYSSRYGSDVQLSYAANAYDFAMLTSGLFTSREERYSADEIINAYAASKPAVGASGPYRFVTSPESGNHFEFDIVVRRIRGERTEEVFRKSLGSTEAKK